AFRTGWPIKIGLINAGLLPDVGEGINGSPVVAPVTCPEGGGGLKVGVTPDAGPGYILNADGSSCYGSAEGKYNALETDISAGNGKVDTPAFPAVGEPSFGTLDGTTTNMFAPVAGLLRALDVIAPDYQKGSQDFTAAWSASTGQFAPNFHHDIANSGDYTRDALAPGKPLQVTIASKVLTWIAPGGDLMCGTAAAYEIVTSASPITPQNFAGATPLSGAPTPAAAGTTQ